MNNLQAFLYPAVPTEDQEIVISRRFLGEDGEPIKFKIRAITQEESERITKKCTRAVKERGSVRRELDSQAYMNQLVLAGTVFPDFSDKELCEGYGVLDPAMVPGKMLLAGEFTRLADAIAELSGINDDNAAEEAKN